MPGARAQPLLIVHTGAMKGKTTAAFGLAMRAWAAGLPVGVYQFVKGTRWRTGEEIALRALGRTHQLTGEGAPVTWHALGRGRPRSGRAAGSERPAAQPATAQPTERPAAQPATAQPTELDSVRAAHRAAAIQGWELVRSDLAAERHGCYLLDELTYPITWGWLDVSGVVATLRDRPGHQHVVVTGRNAPAPLLEVADLVVEMVKIKHPIDVGVRGQRGIEW